MSKRSKNQEAAVDDPKLSTTSVRPRTKGLVKLAAPFVGQNITEFISEASNQRALAILKSHNVRIPAELLVPE